MWSQLCVLPALFVVIITKKKKKESKGDFENQFLLYFDERLKCSQVKHNFQCCCGSTYSLLHISHRTPTQVWFMGSAPI